MMNRVMSTQVLGVDTRVNCVATLVFLKVIRTYALVRPIACPN